jgi:hypothetical protein
MQDFEDDELEELADQLQVGDRTEGAQALRRIMQRSTTDPDAIANGVRSTIARDRVRMEIRDGLQELARTNPDLATDPLLADMGATAMRGQIARDLRDIGATDEMLNPLLGDTKAMVEAYHNIRVAGRGRPFSEIVDAAAKDVRARGVKLRTASDGSPEARRAAAASAVREMRTQRGFSNAHLDDPGPRVAATPITENEQKRQARAHEIMERRRQAYQNVRDGIRSDSQDAY